MTREEFEKAIQAGVKEFEVTNFHPAVGFKKGEKLRLVYDDMSSSPKFRNREYSAYYKLAWVEPVYPAPKFKVGDRVVHPAFGKGTVRYKTPNVITVVFDTAHHMLHSADITLGTEIPIEERYNRCWNFLGGGLEGLRLLTPEKNQKLMLSVKDKKVKVYLLDNGHLKATAEAKCSPDDTFDILIGAQIALQRLAEQTGSKIVIPKSALSNHVELI